MCWCSPPEYFPFSHPKKCQGHPLPFDRLPEFCISFGNTVIEPSDTVDLLGIVIDDELTFHQHVKMMTTNAALKLNALRRQSKWLDPEVRLDYGRTFVLSSFQYCSLVWYFCSRGIYRADILAVEHIQKCKLRIFYEDHDSPFENLLTKCHYKTTVFDNYKADIYWNKISRKKR